METATIETPLGTAVVSGDGNGIAKISISKSEEVVSKPVPEELKDAVAQLKAYFWGDLKKFQLKLNPEGTVFQKKVWTALQQIPYGKTVSYLELAKEMGDAKAVRAVAAANGKNPLWIVVPCHRVIGSDGSLTGYAGELWRKKWLLEHESEAKQHSLFEGVYLNSLF